MKDEVWIRTRTTFYDALTRGELSRIDHTLEKLLGRSPTIIEETVKSMPTSNEAAPQTV